MDGSTAYITGPPCHDCARALIQSGVSTIWIPENHNMLESNYTNNEAWKESIDRANQMYQLSNVDFGKVKEE